MITNLPPSAFYRNDGGELTNDAPEIGADLVMSAMGVTIGDYNGDDMNGMESGASYWHMVDLVWLGLFPMLYVLA